MMGMVLLQLSHLRMWAAPMHPNLEHKAAHTDVRGSSCEEGRTSGRVAACASLMGTGLHFLRLMRQEKSRKLMESCFSLCPLQLGARLIPAQLG